MHLLRVFTLTCATLALMACTTGGSTTGDTATCNTSVGTPTLAANGWPESYAPTDYAGTGTSLGDLAPDFTAQDQNGADMNFSQFYGHMILLDFSALWCVPCNQAAATAQELYDDINTHNDAFAFSYVHVLIDDEATGADADGGYAEVADANTWATDYDIEFPVLAGLGAWEQAVPWNASALPLLYILDPHMEIRGILTAYGGDAALEAAVEGVFDDFCEENPDWVSPF